MAKRQIIKLLVTPPMQRAAALRGVPLAQWLQGIIHRAAWQDIIAARDILEGAGFADKVGRERRERQERDKYRLVPEGTKLVRDPTTGKRTVVRKEKLARIAIVPGYADDEPPTAA